MDNLVKIFELGISIFIFIMALSIFGIQMRQLNEGIDNLEYVMMERRLFHLVYVEE